MLEHWDFADEALNSKPALVNRQKSALNLEVLEVNTDTESATFEDGGLQFACTLHKCTCRDFNFVGKSPRKTFQPCKQIYRLAIELRYMTPTHFDHRLRLSLMDQDERARHEAQKFIKKHPPSLSDWGSWNPNLHREPKQWSRMARRWEVLPELQTENNQSFRHILYDITLSSCTCPDFHARQIPCKHIYALAHKLNLLPDDAPPEEDPADFVYLFPIP